MRVVGVLGGMGPEATILLMQKVMDAMPAQDDADHLPLIVHQNPAVPSRIAHLIEGTGADPAPVLAQMARGLQAAGATALAMPCNTAHAYAPAIRAATPLPFLDMIGATAAALSAKGVRRVGMLASPATRLARVFDAPFATAGLVPVFPGRDAEAEVLALIRAVKRGAAPAALAPGLTRIGQDLMGEADAICVACTELSLLVPHLAPLRVTDSLDALVGAIYAHATG